MEIKERFQKVYLSWAFKIIEHSWVAQVYFKKQQQSDELKKKKKQTWNKLVSSVKLKIIAWSLKCKSWKERGDREAATSSWLILDCLGTRNPYSVFINYDNHVGNFMYGNVKQLFWRLQQRLGDRNGI